jgi:hypothetical protein
MKRKRRRISASLHQRIGGEASLKAGGGCGGESYAAGVWRSYAAVLMPWRLVSSNMA